MKEPRSFTTSKTIFLSLCFFAICFSAQLLRADQCPTDMQRLYCASLTAPVSYETVHPDLNACNPSGDIGTIGYWMYFVGDGYPFTFNLVPQDFPPEGHVYTCQGGSLLCHGTFEDSFRDDGSLFYSTPTEVGIYYYIYVTGEEADNGEFFSMLGGSNFDCPLNRFCNRPTELECGDAVTGVITSDNSNSSGSPTCNSAGDGNYGGQWYQFVGTGSDMTVSLNASGTNFDTQLAIYRSLSSTNPCDNMECVDGADIISSTGGESITVSTVGTTLYYVFVDGWSNSTGEFELSLECQDSCPYWSWSGNCNSSFSTVLQRHSRRADAINCSTGEELPAFGTWVLVDGNGETAQMILIGEFDYRLDLFSCSGSSLTCLEGLDDYGNLKEVDEYLEFPTVNGQQYYIYISSSDPAAQGEYFAIATSFKESCPVNRGCWGAIPITPGQVVTGNTENVSSAVTPPDPCNNSADGDLPGLWYTFRGNGKDITATITASGTDFDTQLALYYSVGDECSATCLDGSDIAGIGGESITINNSSPSSDYQIYVDGWSNQMGDFTLELSTPAGCPAGNFNAFCVNSWTAPIGNMIPDLNMQICDPEFEIRKEGYVFGIDGTGEMITVYGNSNSFDLEGTIYICNGNSLNCIGTFNENLQSVWEEQYSFQSIAGQQYYAYFSGDDAELGEYVSMRASYEQSCPANNYCVSAPTLQCGDIVTGDITSLADSPFGKPDDSCGGGGDGNGGGLWYRIAGTGQEITATLNASGTNFDSQLAVYYLLGSDCDNLECAGGSDIASNSGGESYSFFTASGNIYYIYVDGYLSNVGSFELEIACDSYCPSGYPSSCFSSISSPLYEIPQRADLVDCETGEALSGLGFWYEVIGNGEQATVAVYSTLFDTEVHVFTCSGNTLSCYDFIDNNAGEGTIEDLFNLPTVDGESYHLLITANGTYEPGTYFGISTFYAESCPGNSICERAMPICCGESLSGNIENTNTVTTEVDPCGAAGDGTDGGQWFSWNGTGETVMVNIPTSGTTFDAQLAIYTGNSCSSLACVQGNDIAGNGGESVTFTANQGTDYFFYVDGWSGQTGDFVLQLECPVETSVDLRIMLEGPYDSSGNMYTNLAGLIPQMATGAYGSAPYNYTGSETKSFAFTDMVDWVLVEARQGTPDPTNASRGTTTIETLAAIVTPDGYLRAPDFSPLTFTKLAKGQAYYFAVRHRNHLDVLTSRSFAGGIDIVYDFSSAENQAFGIEQLKPTGDGYFALHSGDYNQDNVIQNTDFDDWQIEPAAINQYRLTDGNLDGVVQNTDFDEWNENKAKIGSIELSYQIIERQSPKRLCLYFPMDSDGDRRKRICYIR